MTNLEVLKGSVSGGFTDLQLSTYLVKVGLEPTNVYVTENEKKIDLATIETIIYLMGTSQSVRELDYQITYRSNAEYQMLINKLYAKWGIPNPYLQNKVTGKAIW